MDFTYLEMLIKDLEGLESLRNTINKQNVKLSWEFYKGGFRIFIRIKETLNATKEEKLLKELVLNYLDEEIKTRKSKAKEESELLKFKLKDFF